MVSQGNILAECTQWADLHATEALPMLTADKTITRWIDASLRELCGDDYTPEQQRALELLMAQLVTAEWYACRLTTQRAQRKARLRIN